MAFPAYYDEVPPIRLFDPLAEALGASDDGTFEVRYADAVRLAGHSCPTLAGAWLMTARALALLWPGGLPERGAIGVESRRDADEGVAGVVASVATLVTGAAGEGGFKGLGGRFSRRNLLAFGAPIEGDLRFTRLDTGASVELAHRAEVVPMPESVRLAMHAAFHPGADAAARRRFAAAWQAWVRDILVGHADDPRLVVRVG